MVKGFSNPFDADIATHARLEIDLTGSNKTSSINVQHKPKSLSSTIKEYIAEHSENLQDEKEKNMMENETYDRLNKHMDDEVAKVKIHLQDLAAKWKTEEFGEIFSVAVEHAYATTCSLELEEARNIRGHDSSAF